MEFEFAKSRGMCVCMPTCFRASVVCVKTYLCANVPKACQLFIFTCQRAIRRAIVSTRRCNVPKGVPIFQILLSQNAKGVFYNLFLHKKFYFILDIIVIHIICLCILHKNCIMFHHYTSSHIEEQFVEFLLFKFFLFFS